MEDLSSYKTIEETFEIKDKTYKAILVPELCQEEDELDFTGSYHCILIRSDKGTIAFDLTPDAGRGWVCEPRGIDNGIIDELGNIIAEYRK